jgi:hypothetical protein
LQDDFYYLVNRKNNNMIFSFFSVGNFGRRASDGGANLQMFFQRHAEGAAWSQPGSQEHVGRPLSPANYDPMLALTPDQTDAQPSDDSPDMFAVAR